MNKEIKPGMVVWSADHEEYFLRLRTDEKNHWVCLDNGWITDDTMVGKVEKVKNKYKIQK